MIVIMQIKTFYLNFGNNLENGGSQGGFCTFL